MPSGHCPPRFCTSPPGSPLVVKVYFFLSYCFWVQMPGFIKIFFKKITIFLIILQYSFDNNPILFILSISLLVYYLACYYLYILCLRKLLVASHKVLCIIIQRQQGEIQGLRWGSVVSITLKWWTLIVLSLMLRSKNIENKLWCLAAESQIRITLLWTTNWSQPVELGLISNSIYTLKGKS